MAPHDLLCKWCSTFVGKDKKFCSIFCESRFTRSKRRKLAIKRPIQPGPTGQSPEFESPRTSRSNFTKKEQFLDDVISAMKISTDKTDEREKHSRLFDGLKDEAKEEDAKTSSARMRAIPKLDLSSTRKENKGIGSARKKDGDKPEMLKSKTRTIFKGNANSRIPISSNGKSDEKDTSKNSPENEKKETLKDNRHFKKDKETFEKRDRSKETPRTGNKSSEQNDATKEKVINGNKTIEKRDKSKEKTSTESKAVFEQNDTSAIKQTGLRTVKTIKSASTSEAKENVPEFGVPAPITKTRSALDLEHRVRSSGYGAPVNPKIRPAALKPRSASFITNTKRQTSASSVKSNQTGDLRTKKIEALPDLLRETSHPIGRGIIGKRDLVPKIIEEETSKTVKHFPNPSIENNTPVSSTRNNTGKKNTTTRTERTELKILREESTASDLLDTSQIQDRLSSIKRKVEVRRRGRDSRSSTGSDFDASFLDSSIDLTTDRDALNASQMKSKSVSARISARSNITRISKSFQPSQEIK